MLQLAYQRGFISADERRRVFGVMRQLGLAIWHDVCTVDVLMQVGLLCLCLDYLFDLQHLLSNFIAV